jgi:hypothetical protein
MKPNFRQILVAVVAVATLATIFGQSFSTAEKFRYTDTAADVRAKLVQSGMTVGQFAKVALIQSGATNTVNATTVTQSFTTAYSAAPVLILTADATNAHPFIVSVTTSNFVAGTHITNRVVRWLAMPATQ